MTTLILGVFESSYFELCREFNAQKYDYSVDATPTNHDDDLEHKVVAKINTQLRDVDQCVFDITHIDLRMNELSFKISVTVRELHLVITTPEYLAKTEFFIDGVMQDKNKVVEEYLFQPFWDEIIK